LSLKAPNLASNSRHLLSSSYKGKPYPWLWRIIKFFFYRLANKSPYYYLFASIAIAALCIASISSTLYGFEPSYCYASLTNFNTSSASFSIESYKVSTKQSAIFLKRSSIPSLNGKRFIFTQSTLRLSGSFLSSILLLLIIVKLIAQSSTFLKFS